MSTSVTPIQPDNISQSISPVTKQKTQETQLDTSIPLSSQLKPIPSQEARKIGLQLIEHLRTLNSQTLTTLASILTKHSDVSSMKKGELFRATELIRSKEYRTDSQQLDSSHRDQLNDIAERITSKAITEHGYVTSGRKIVDRDAEMGAEVGDRRPIVKLKTAEEWMSISYKTFGYRSQALKELDKAVAKYNAVKVEQWQEKVELKAIQELQTALLVFVDKSKGKERSAAVQKLQNEIHEHVQDMFTKNPMYIVDDLNTNEGKTLLSILKRDPDAFISRQLPDLFKRMESPENRNKLGDLILKLQDVLIRAKADNSLTSSQANPFLHYVTTQSILSGWNSTLVSTFEVTAKDLFRNAAGTLVTQTINSVSQEVKPRDHDAQDRVKEGKTLVVKLLEKLDSQQASERIQPILDRHVLENPNSPEKGLAELFTQNLEGTKAGKVLKAFNQNMFGVVAESIMMPLLSIFNIPVQSKQNYEINLMENNQVQIIMEQTVEKAMDPDSYLKTRSVFTVDLTNTQPPVVTIGITDVSQKMVEEVKTSGKEVLFNTFLAQFPGEVTSDVT